MVLPDWWTGRSVRSGGPLALQPPTKAQKAATDAAAASAAASAGTTAGRGPFASGYQFGPGSQFLPGSPLQDLGGGVTGPTRPDPVLAAAAAAEAAANAARTAAGNSAVTRAANLDPQIAALKYALDTSFKQGLDQNLGDVGKLLEEQTAMLKEGSSKRAASFLEGAENTKKATAGQADESISNFVRERQDAMASMLEQGAGQTDLLRGLVSSARNWRQNAQEGNRALFDSMTSTNAAINDLNLDTQSALGNVHTSAESEKDRLWQDFYNRRSESFTQLGNLATQQAHELTTAKEMKVGKGGDEKKATAATAYMDAAKEAGKSYTKQALPGWISKYEGVAPVKAEVSNTDLAAAPTYKNPGRAKGAQLRGWGT